MSTRKDEEGGKEVEEVEEVEELPPARIPPSNCPKRTKRGWLYMLNGQPHEMPREKEEELVRKLQMEVTAADVDHVDGFVCHGFRYTGKGEYA